MEEKQNNRTKTMREIIDIAEQGGWSVEYTQSHGLAGDYLSLQKYSPYGQDFHVGFAIPTGSWKGPAGTAIERFQEYIDNFDVSEQAYLWLDSSGHGKNGAPYEMIDVYNDMEDCKEMMQELLNMWKN